ncbi:MAG: acyclic terpene utilization AtuA family protein [Erysipelotrichaceae bacterium]
MKSIKVLSATAILGYGFPLASFEAGMKMKPDCIAVDAGSTDPGPYYLGAGVSFTDYLAVKRDLSIMIQAGIEHNIPVLIGSAGGSGAKPHLDWTVKIIKEIATENKLHFRLAVIEADFDKQYLLEEFEKGNIKPLHPAPECTREDIIDSTYIVGQMGVEPFIKALNDKAQVIVAGRAYDPTVFAALAIMNGFDPGLALHCGKILECAAIASTPGSGSDCMFGTIYEDSFVLQTLNPIRKCTTLSVSAHTLYEKTNPYILPGPGGTIDLHETTFTQLDEDRVEVKGSKFIPSDPYTIKLEGAKCVGYRTVSIAGVRDPIFIQEVDSIIEAVTSRVKDNFKNLEGYHLNFKIYGKNGVMGDLEPIKEITSHEICIVIDAVAKTQEVANTVCGFARSTMLHYGYKGRIATAGNLAFPYSPSDFKVGPVYNFSLYHLIAIKDPIAPFKQSIVEL